MKECSLNVRIVGCRNERELKVYVRQTIEDETEWDENEVLESCH